MNEREGKSKERGEDNKEYEDLREYGKSKARTREDFSG